MVAQLTVNGRSMSGTYARMNDASKQAMDIYGRMTATIRVICADIEWGAYPSTVKVRIGVPAVVLGGAEWYSTAEMWLFQNRQATCFA